MKRTTVLIVILFASLVAHEANAGKPVPLYAEFAGGTTHVYPLVEQQSCDPILGCWHQYGSEGTVCSLDPVPEIVTCNRTVDPDPDGVNDPRRCLWDVDDHTEVRFLGDRLGPGQSVSITKCLIGDTGWVFGFRQYGGDLLGTITIDLDTGRDFTLSSRTDFCVGGPSVKTLSPLMQSIPDSNGGVGVPGQVTWTVTNDSDRAVRFGKLSGINAGSGNLGMSTYDDRWCPEGFPLVSSVDGGADGGGWDADGVGYWWDS